MGSRGARPAGLPAASPRNWCACGLHRDGARPAELPAVIPGELVRLRTPSRRSPACRIAGGDTRGIWCARGLHRDGARLAELPAASPGNWCAFGLTSRGARPAELPGALPGEFGAPADSHRAEPGLPNYLRRSPGNWCACGLHRDGARLAELPGALPTANSLCRPAPHASSRFQPASLATASRPSGILQVPLALASGSRRKGHHGTERCSSSIRLIPRDRRSIAHHRQPRRRSATTVADPQVRERNTRGGRGGFALRFPS